MGLDRLAPDAGFVAALVAVVPVAMDVELWIDADGFARRLVTTTHRRDATVTTTTDYRPNAAPASRPEAPPAGEVVDVSELEARARAA